MPPRTQGKRPGRADDPMSAALTLQMNRMNIVGRTQTSTGTEMTTGSKSDHDGDGDDSKPKRTPLPTKGGRPIHMADVIEQRGRLTPLQMHRMLASTQAHDKKWSRIEDVARVYGVSAAAVTSVQQHLSLPYIVHESELQWHGGATFPTDIQIKRALGHATEVNMLGQHVRIDQEAERRVEDGYNTKTKTKMNANTPPAAGQYQQQ